MELERRVDRLERQIVRWRAVAIGITGLALLGIAVGLTDQPGTPEVIQAKRFEVVDGEGQVLVEISSHDGLGYLVTKNTDGKSLLSLDFESFSRGGEINVYDGEDNRVAKISQSRETGSVSTYGPGETSSVLIGLGRGGGTLATFSEDGEAGVALSQNEFGGLVQVMRIADSRPVVRLGVERLGNGAVVVFGNGEHWDHPRALLGVQSDSNAGALTLFDASSKEMARLGEAKGAGALRLSLEHKKPVVMAGADSNGNGMLNIRESDGARRVSLAVSDRFDAGTVKTFERDGTAAIALGHSGTAGSLTLCMEGRPIVNMGTSAGGGAMEFLGADDKPRLSLGLTSGGDGGIKVSSLLGEARLQLGVSDDLHEGMIKAHNAVGEEIFHLGYHGKVPRGVIWVPGEDGRLQSLDDRE